ncbi:MAG TPA: gamma-glutamyl-gamma-aminobutyrate hydrolase family protein [Pirellulales bacterium]|jgi:CTP synthase (UTP-ammonia lyase)
MTTTIAIIGDLPSDNRFHVATNEAIEHAATVLGIKCQCEWIGTDELADNDLERRLSAFNAIWIAPGSPYNSMDAALAAIRFAREKQVPLLGTCGGFQHIVLEYARNALGIADASHAETDPYASVLFISRLACSLVGRTMTITIEPRSRLARAYGTTTVEEGYYCNFGVNPDYIPALRSGNLRIVAADQEGEVRAVELPDQPFFIGTLFIPQMQSTPKRPHPLILAFINAARPKP